MKYTYNIYTEFKRNNSAMSYIENHLLDTMFNELALKPRSELPHVVAFLMGTIKFLKYMATPKYYKSPLNQLTPEGYKLVKLCDVRNRIKEYHLSEIKTTRVKKHPQIIKEFFPILGKFFGVEVKGNNLLTAACCAVINQDFENYKKEIELIFAGLHSYNLSVEGAGHFFGFKYEIKDEVRWNLFNNFYNGILSFSLRSQYFIDVVLTSDKKLDEFINRYNQDSIPINIDILTKSFSLFSKINLIEPFFETVMEKTRKFSEENRKVGLLDLVLSIKNLFHIDKNVSKEIIELFNLNDPQNINKYLEQIKPESTSGSSYAERISNGVVNIKMLFIETKEFIPLVVNTDFQKQLSFLNFMENKTVVRAENSVDLIHNAWEISNNNQKIFFCSQILNKLTNDCIRFVDRDFITEEHRIKLLNLFKETKDLPETDKNNALPVIVSGWDSNPAFLDEIFKIIIPYKLVQVFNKEVLNSLNQEDLDWMNNRLYGHVYPLRSVVKFIQSFEHIPLKELDLTN